MSLNSLNFLSCCEGGRVVFIIFMSGNMPSTTEFIHIRTVDQSDKNLCDAFPIQIGVDHGDAV